MVGETNQRGVEVKQPPLTFEQFASQAEVVISGDVAEILLPSYLDPTAQVRLIGFTADAGLSPYEVIELGFEYYEELLEECRQ